MSDPQHPGQAPCSTPRCDNPTHDQAIACRSCVDAVRADLRELPGLLAELEITLTRQDATGGEHVPEPPEEWREGDGPPAATTALLFRPMASDVGRYVHEVLAHWTDHLLGALRITPEQAFDVRPPFRAPGPTAWTVEYAAWLERHPDGIATDPDAGALVENIRAAVEDVRRVVFPRQLNYVGPCVPECGEQLYAPAGAEHVRCRACRRRWVIADRVVELREYANGVMLNAEQMAKVLPRIAADIPIRPLNADQIRGFGRRGRLEKFPPHRTPRYKLGEVIALMHALLKEEVARQERLAARASATTHDRVAAAQRKFLATLLT